jgi:hypothetical protein
MIDFSQIYIISEAWTRGALRAELDINDQNDFDLLWAKAPIKDPLSWRPASGRTACDLIGTTWAILYLISPRFIRVLQDSRSRGWTSFPIRSSRLLGNRLKGYAGLSVMGRCGLVREDQCQKVKRAPIVTGGAPFEAHVGLFFDPASWDGSDVFCPLQYGGILVTDRVKQAIEAANLTNVRFVRASEYQLRVVPDPTV